MILEAMLLAAATAPAAPAPASPAPIACTLPIPPQLPPVAPGIQLIQAMASCGTHSAHVSILMVDMTTPNRSVRTTTPPATAPQSATNTANVGSSFPLMLPTVALSSLPSSPLKAFVPQAAVNANLFTNCCSYIPKDWKYPGTFLLGLQITDGQMNVPILGNGYMPCSQQSSECFPFEFDATLLIDSSNHAMIRRIDTQAELNALPAIVTAVTGSHMLVFGKQVVTKMCPTNGCGGEFYQANARTAVGVIGTDTLVIIAVDRGGMSTGLQLDELATLLSANLHVDAAINLDGGGSTTMAVVTKGGPTIVNNPADSGTNGCTVHTPNDECERYVGDALVVGVIQDGTARRRP